MKVYAIVKKGKSKGKVFEVLYGLNFLGGFPLANTLSSVYKVLAKQSPIYNSKNLEIISEERAKNILGLDNKPLIKPSVDLKDLRPLNEYMFQDNGNNFFASNYEQIITSAKTQLMLRNSKELYIYKLIKIVELRTDFVVLDPK